MLPFYADMERGVFERLLEFLNRLDRAHIFYGLDHQARFGHASAITNSAARRLGEHPCSRRGA